MKRIVTILSLICVCLSAHSQHRVVVDQSGSGEFKTIQEAINSLPTSSITPRIIFIKKGTYNEKVFVEKGNIIFEGEDRENTIITQDIARDEWRCSHPDDWGVATMNVNGNDITLKNLHWCVDDGEVARATDSPLLDIFL